MAVVPAYAETTSFTNANPTWYSYDCSASPNAFTLASPSEGSKFQYFSFIQGGTCYANLIGYNTEPMVNMYNTTEINYRADTKARHVTNPALSDNYDISCNLFYFDSLMDLTSSLSETPTKIGSFACGVSSNSTIQQNRLYLASPEITDIETRIQTGNNTIYFMVIPNYTAGFVAGLGSSSFGIEKYLDRLTFVGSGFDCTVIFESNMCGWFDDPWSAVKKMLGEDYIGDWFYVFIWFPFPFLVFLGTRNATYAGFVGMGIMLVIESISQTIFEIALSMILISAGFVFYDLFKKRLMND